MLNLQATTNNNPMDVHAKAYVGGIAAVNNGLIVSCAITGNMSSYSSGRTASTHSVGGISGINYGTISKCLSRISISETNKYDQSQSNHWIGGLIGDNSGTIECCLFLGSVSGTNLHCSNAICAYTADNGTVTNCYKASTITTEGGTAATVTYLNKASFYTDTLGWDDEIWNFSSLDFEAGKYPTLK